MKAFDTIKANPAVKDVWSEYGDGHWIDLQPGFRSSSTGTHSIHEDTVKELLADLKRIEVCNCERCGS